MVVKIFENPLRISVDFFDRFLGHGHPLVVQHIVAQNTYVLMHTFLADVGEDPVRCRRLELLVKASYVFVPAGLHGLIEHGTKHAGSGAKTSSLDALSASRTSSTIPSGTAVGSLSRSHASGWNDTRHSSWRGYWSAG